jgi:DNA-binding transcriptional MerR regulator
MLQKDNWTVSQLAGEFDISTRTIRFYEEKGLLAPTRTRGGHRYLHEERTAPA